MNKPPGASELTHPESYVVPYELMRRLWATVDYYSSEHTYRGERTGGVLQGCPHGPDPTPEQLTFEARQMMKQLTEWREGLSTTAVAPAVAEPVACAYGSCEHYKNICTKVATTDLRGGVPLCQACYDENVRVSIEWDHKQEEFYRAQGGYSPRPTIPAPPERTAQPTEDDADDAKYRQLRGHPVSQEQDDAVQDALGLPHLQHAQPTGASEAVAIIEGCGNRTGAYLTHCEVKLRVFNGYVPKTGDSFYTAQPNWREPLEALHAEFLEIANGSNWDSAISNSYRACAHNLRTIINKLGAQRGEG